MDSGVPLRTAMYTAEAGGQQLQKIGGTLQNLGAEGARLAINAQDQANQVRVNDALNQARAAALKLTFDPQNGYLAQKGVNALDRDSGQPLPEEYAGKLNETISTISGSLGNDAQRLAFSQHAAGLVNSFSGDVQKHTFQEFGKYQDSTDDATMKLESDTAKLNWQDPAKVDASVASVRAAAYNKAQRYGLGGDAATEVVQQASSAVHHGVILAALQNGNPIYAQQYLQKNKDQMSADDILKVNGLINHDVDGRVANLAVQNTTQKFTPQMQPSNLDRLKTLVLGQESGNHDFNPDGTPVTSIKGAKYSMQVMPATAKNPGFGVEPAKDDSPAEYNRVGTAYLQAMVQKYGNVGQALAAYNGGPGAVDNAVAKATKAGTPGNWLSFMPKETQAYVAAIAPKFNVGAGAPSLPTELDFVNDAVNQLGPNPRPEQVKLTRAAAEQQFTLAMKSRTEQGDQALGRAQQALIANGGDFNSLDPQIKADLAGAAPGKYDDAMRFANTLASNSAGSKTETDMKLYATLAMHPDALAQLTDAEFIQMKTKLSDADFKHFANERSSLVNGESDQTIGSVNSKALLTALNERLINVGVDTSPKKTDSAGLARYGAIYKYVRNDVLTQQQQSGHKLTAAEVEKQVDNLFARNFTFRNTVMGIEQDKTSTMPQLSMKVNDIPNEDRNALQKAFEKAGVKTPTDGDMLRAYWVKKNGR